MERLKPCPFCGCTEETGCVNVAIVPVESFLRAKTVEFYCVKCDICGAKTGNHNTRAGAIKAWNRRAEGKEDLNGETD